MGAHLFLQVRWSPFVPSLFLSCSSDWTVRLWQEDKVGLYDRLYTFFMGIHVVQFHARQAFWIFGVNSTYNTFTLSLSPPYKDNIAIQIIFISLWGLISYMSCKVPLYERLVGSTLYRGNGSVTHVIRGEVNNLNKMLVGESVTCVIKKRLII